MITDIGAEQAFPILDFDQWIAKGYEPTPTIIEAAQVLYQNHSVADIRAPMLTRKTYMG